MLFPALNVSVIVVLAGIAKLVPVAPLGPADGPVKNAIFGGNNARLYHYKPQQRADLENDKLTRYKTQYAESGAGRTNLADGYALRAPA